MFFLPPAHSASRILSPACTGAITDLPAGKGCPGSCTRRSRTPVCQSSKNWTRTLCDVLERGHRAYFRARYDISASLFPKAGVPDLPMSGLYKRLSSNVIMHSWIGRHIAHLLRIRVLEELDVLAYNLCHIPKGGQEAPLLRRLTRAEWKQVKSSGVLPYKNAVALLVVPPLNKDPVTKSRPKRSTSATPPPVEEQPANIVRPGPPISILLPTSDEPIEEDDSRDVPMFLSRSKVPLYNGISLFPSRSHRAALHAGLLRVLDYERQARFQEHAIDVARAWATKSAEEVRKLKSKVPRAYGDQKASHAFLLCSDANTLMRADAVPLAIALWRIRIWEGAGWEGSDATANGWILD